MTLLVATPNYSAITRERANARLRKRYQATAEQLRFEVEMMLGRTFDPQMSFFERLVNLVKRVTA